ncbi:type I restriction modification DNA specificity domain protein [bacterium BMS3Abin06]|nr:type I restriction modification DNA specificity domain protein [bacterium BMS3Abin06]
MGEWKEYNILDLAEIHNQSRVPLSKMQRAKKQGVYPYYGASGIIDYVDDYLFDGEFVLISEDGENLKSRQTPIAFKANGQFWVNNHAHILKGLKPFHNDLMIYYFQNMDLNPYITGAVQPKLNKANLLSIPIYLPEDEAEQKAIASVLSSLDDKIDLLHRQNKTLESMAETLFRQWFVEEAQEDWEAGCLGDVIELVYGKGLKKEIRTVRVIQ